MRFIAVAESQVHDPECIVAACRSRVQHEQDILAAPEVATIVPATHQ
jgi:hypothetical protein